MSLEQKLEANTAALEALTAALATAGVKNSADTKTATAGSTETKTTKTTKTTKEEPKSKHTRQEMTAALNEVKEKFGAADAKGLIKSKGGVDKMADVPDEKIDAVYDAAKAKVDGDEGADEGDGL